LDLTYDNSDLSRKTAVAIASMWQKVLGIKINLVATEWANYLEKRRNSDFEVLRNSWGAAFNHVTTYTPEYACASNVNASRLCTVNYDEMIINANNDLNEEQQTQFYERALQLAMDQYAVIPLYQNSYTMMIHPNITGLQVESNLLHDIRSKWINKH
jgi:oligopeptide transport system substrate-binding protein